MTTMRAKFQVSSVIKHEGDSESVAFNAVSKSDGPYPDDGHDDDNTYARWSPSASCTIQIANPNLWGQFKVGDKFYVDFTRA